MGKADIQKLYRRLTKDFSTLPFEAVLTQCYDIAKKYYSCYPLLFQLGVLLVNHSMLASGPGPAAEIMETALKWFCRVSSESDEPDLQKQALYMEAYCLLALNRPAEVLDLLDIGEAETGSPEPLLASAYQMMGSPLEARKVLQAGIYKEVLSVFDLLSAYVNLCLDDPDHFEEACLRLRQLADTFQIESLHPGILLGAYITIAQGWMALGNTEQALDALSQYTNLAVSDIYPLRLHGDDFFSLLDDWFAGTLTHGSYPPRDDAVVRRSMTQALTETPSFLPLSENKRFQSMITRLKMNEEEQ